MKKIITLLEQMPKWLGLCIILLYAFLFAEFLSVLNHILLSNNELSNNLLNTIFKLNYAVNILSSILIWIVTTYLFHLVALLFDGQCVFKRFLFLASYLYIIPMCAILIALFIVNDIASNGISILLDNSVFKFATNLINASFILYYILLSVIICYIYQIKYIYSILSIVMPIATIWLISLLFI